MQVLFLPTLLDSSFHSLRYFSCGYELILTLKQGKSNRGLTKEHAGYSKHTFPTTPDIREYHQMITLIIFFAARDREVLYSQQKQDLELTVTQIMSSLLQNSGLS